MLDMRTVVITDFIGVLMVVITDLVGDLIVVISFRSSFDPDLIVVMKVLDTVEVVMTGLFAETELSEQQQKSDPS